MSGSLALLRSAVIHTWCKTSVWPDLTFGYALILVVWGDGKNHHPRGQSTHMTRPCTALPALFLTLPLAFVATGCSSTSGEALDRTLQAVGLQKPAAAEQLKDLPPIPTFRSVTLRLHAGTVLNTDTQGRSLALVARVYRLKNTEAFLRSPYESFQTETSSGQPPFAQDVIEMREVVLTPGQQWESIEKLGMDVGAIGVVGLFRAPQQNRWRFVFDAKSAAASGVTLGLHGCAMSVAQGQPVGAAAEQMRVAGVRCQ